MLIATLKGACGSLGKEAFSRSLGISREKRSCCNENIQGAAKGGRQKEFDHFFRFLVTFWSLFSSLFCHTPFAGLLLRQGETFFVQVNVLSGLEKDDFLERSSSWFWKAFATQISRERTSLRIKGAATRLFKGLRGRFLGC